MMTASRQSTRLSCGTWVKQATGVLVFQLDGVDKAKVTSVNGRFAVHFVGQRVEANLVRDTEREAIEAVADLVSFGACDVR
jgi:hypothetical protein